MTDLPMPRGIALLTERLSGDLASLAVGAEVTTEHLRDQRWRITARSPRVLMWVEAEPLQRGRLKWRASELHIDGRRIERRNYDDMLSTFADPDGTGEQPPRSDVPLVSAPESVTRLIRMVNRSAPGRFAPSVQRSGNLYLITLIADRIRVVCRVRETFDYLHPARPIAIDLDGDIDLWVDGIDRSAEAGKSLAAAMATATSFLAHPPPPPIDRTAPAAVRATSIQVRNTTVIRN